MSDIAAGRWTDRARTIGAMSAAFLGLCVAACNSEPAQASVLFASGESRLAPAELKAIEAAFTEHFSLSDDGLHLVDENCGEIPARTEIVDLNGDGEYEVFVFWGNTCTSGHAESSLSLFTRDSSGRYRQQLGFPAASYTALLTGKDSYPDLQFGGPGFCFAVWSWNGNNYEFKCNSPQEEGGCQYTGNVCQSD